MSKAKKRKLSRTVIDAVLMNDLPNVREAISQGADVNTRDINEDGETLLILAAYFASAEMARFLLDKGADIHARDDHGRTVCRFASLNLLAFLLQKGADLNAQDNDGVTCLMSAAEGGDRERIHWLLAHGADPHITDANGETAWDHAYSFGQVYIAEDLQKAMDATKDALSGREQQSNLAARSAASSPSLEDTMLPGSLPGW